MLRYRSVGIKKHILSWWPGLHNSIPLTILLLLVAACSGGGGSSPAPNPTPPSVSAPLPPDPGSAGLATIAGRDSNNNGVRDDLERYIALTYPNPVEAGTRAAMTQYVKAEQTMLLDAADPQKSMANAINLGHAIECLLAIRPADFNQAFTQLDGQVLNTDNRVDAYLTADEKLGGLTYEVTPPEQGLTLCH